MCVPEVGHCGLGESKQVAGMEVNSRKELGVSERLGVEPFSAISVVVHVAWWNCSPPPLSRLYRSCIIAATYIYFTVVIC